MPSGQNQFSSSKNSIRKKSCEGESREIIKWDDEWLEKLNYVVFLAAPQGKWSRTWVKRLMLVGKNIFVARISFFTSQIYIGAILMVTYPRKTLEKNIAIS